MILPPGRCKRTTQQQVTGNITQELDLKTLIGNSVKLAVISRNEQESNLNTKNNQEVNGNKAENILEGIV